MMGAQLQAAAPTTRVRAPPVRPRAIRRARLFAQVDRVWEVRAVIVVAPAGFGKTTLLSECAQTNSRRVAWLSLDAAENDPVRFWMHTIGALQQVWPGACKGPLMLLTAPEAGAAAAGLAALVNELAAATDDLTLVLDDFHLIDSPAVHAAVASLLEHPPVRLHLVLASRTDLPFSIARLRARGQLTELHAADLCFTPEEVAAFLSEVMRLQLRGEHIAALAAHTEGWPAGLQLAALALQTRQGSGRSPPTPFVDGANRLVVDFLVEEVFAHQSPELQQFLLHTAVLNRLCASLCEAVTGQPGGAATIQALEQANLFLVPLDDARRWYRYHHLFGDMLRIRLRQTEPSVEPELNRRAAAWCEAAGLHDEAVEYCLSAGAYSTAGGIIESLSRTMLQRGEMVTLQSWLDRLPDDVARGQLEAVSSHLQSADEVFAHMHPAEAAPLIGEVAALRAVLASVSQNLPVAIAEGQAALASLASDDYFLRGLSAFGLGNAHLWSGDLSSARLRLDEAAALNRLAGNAPIALASVNTLALLNEVQGRLHDASALYDQVLQAGESDGGTLPLVAVASAHIGKGGILREWNRLDEALEATQRGIALGQAWGSSAVLAGGYYGLARIYQAHGDLDGALAQIDAADTAFRRAYIANAIPQVAAYRALLRLAKGDTAAAFTWAASRRDALRLPPDVNQGQPNSPPLEPALEFERLVLARIMAAGGEMAEGESLLAHLLASAEATERISSVMKILAAQAVNLHICGELDLATATLVRALVLAEPGGHIRLFVDEGSAIAGLLRAALVRRIAPGYTAQLLDAFNPSAEWVAPASVSTLVEPLTARERDVLRLLAAGLSNAAIADELVIVVGTVKRHLNSAYGKLGTASRTQAVARARELGLV